MTDKIKLVLGGNYMKYESVLETFRDGEIVIPMYMYKIRVA